MNTFDTLAPQEEVNKTREALLGNGIVEVLVVETGAEALQKIQELIPAGSAIMNGASTTLQEIGYIDFLKSGNHTWNNVHEAILEEEDADKKKQLRNQALFADYYVGSAHAVTEEGELLIASNSGSQLPHLAFTSPNIILVVSTQKIVSDLAKGFERIKEHVVPLEDKRMHEAMGQGTLWAKTLILHKENPMMGRTIKVIFINEKLGF